MSNSIIEDGTGAGNKVKVDIDNRLHTGSISRTERNAAINRGDLFITNTGIITLTDDVETPILYVNNTEDRNLYLDLFDLTVGASTGGSGNIIVKTFGGIDASSTIITEAKPGNVGNANAGSQKIFIGEVYKGETGDTLVGGANFNSIIMQSGDSRFKTDTSAVLPKGINGAFTVKAPAGNTSMAVSLLFLVYYLDENLPK